MTASVTVSAKEFQIFISSIENVDRTGCVITLHKHFMEALTMSEDGASIILYGKILIQNPEDIPLREEETENLYIKDITKFKKLLDLNDSEEFTFNIENSYISYKSSKIRKAKFMLDIEPRKMINKRITAKWFNSFEKNLKFTIDKKVIKEILQCAAFADKSNKIYFGEDAEKHNIYAELNDRTLTSIDNLSLTITEDYEGHMNNQSIIYVTSLSKLCLATNEILVESSTINEFDILFFTLKENGVETRYLFNSIADQQ